jgi:protein phosphatase
MSIAVRWASATHVGCVRSLNQDAVLAGPSVFAVADGMGGHAAGEVASAIAIAHLAQLPAACLESDVLAALSDANSRIRAEGYPGSGREGMGTTVAGLALAREDGIDRVLVFNVGDSRTYQFDQSGLRQVSTDHSLVAEMVSAGELTAADARTHSARNVVTRALGIDVDVDVDRWWLPTRPHDRFLLCSDGLTNEVDEEEIADVMQREAEPQAVVDALLRLALDAGARDNVSVVLVQIEHVLAGGSELDDDTNPKLVITDGTASAPADPVVVQDASASTPDGADGDALITGVPSRSDQDDALVGS